MYNARWNTVRMLNCQSAITSDYVENIIVLEVCTEIFTVHVYDQGLVSRVCEELCVSINPIKPNNPIKKKKQRTWIKDTSPKKQVNG